MRENSGVSIIDSGRARFNWQDRKRADLKHQAESCQRCSMTDVCEGVWAGYTEIYGFSEFAPLEWEKEAMVRGAPRPAAAPVGTALETKKRFPRRLTVLQG